MSERRNSRSRGPATWTLIATTRGLRLDGYKGHFHVASLNMALSSKDAGCAACACDKYKLDMTAVTFGTCVCGFPKSAHANTSGAMPPGKSQKVNALTAQMNIAFNPAMLQPGGPPRPYMARAESGGATAAPAPLNDAAATAPAVSALAAQMINNAFNPAMLPPSGPPKPYMARAEADGSAAPPVPSSDAAASVPSASVCEVVQPMPVPTVPETTVGEFSVLGRAPPPKRRPPRRLTSAGPETTADEASKADGVLAKAEAATTAKAEAAAHTAAAARDVREQAAKDATAAARMAAILSSIDVTEEFEEDEDEDVPEISDMKTSKGHLLRAGSRDSLGSVASTATGTHKRKKRRKKKSHVKA